jgi:hypothetical protein
MQNVFSGFSLGAASAGALSQSDHFLPEFHTYDFSAF